MIHASRPPAAPFERSIPATERLEEAVAAAEVEMLRTRTLFGEAPSEPAAGGEVGALATTRMHVRVGLEGLEDADREQEPTVWAVAGGGSSDIKGEKNRHRRGEALFIRKNESGAAAVEAVLLSQAFQADGRAHYLADRGKTAHCFVCLESHSFFFTVVFFSLRYASVYLYLVRT